MWTPRGIQEKVVAVAIDKDKRSQNALKWALDHVLTKGQTVRLIHVDQPQLPIPTPSNSDGTARQELHDLAADLFLPFRCFCSRREVIWEAVTLEEQDIVRALIDYICFNRVDTLVLGAPSKKGISRLFKSDIPSAVLKGVPYFCSVYVISKGKVVSERAASHPLPTISGPERTRSTPNRNSSPESDSIVRATDTRLHDEFTIPETDFALVSSGRLSTDSTFFAFYDHLGSEVSRLPPRALSVASGSLDPLDSVPKFPDFDSSDELSTKRTLHSTQNSQETEEKMSRLEVQMKQTMDMYHAACKEALAAKHKARELELLQMENEKRLDEAERAKEHALIIAEEERGKCKAALKIARVAYRKAEQEAQWRIEAEMRAVKEAEDKKMMLNSLGQSHVVLQHQSLLHIVVVLFVFYLYFFELR